jgi:UrcA family protein
MTLKIALVALATLAFATSPTSASANANPFAKDKAILTLQDLDLSTADGQQRLAIRVDQAARAVCGDRLSGLHLSVEAKAQECRASVSADVRSQIEARLASASAPASKRLASAR